MSNINNERILESAYEDFKDFLYRKDFESAKQLIDEIAENGFVREAVDMCREMLKVSMAV